MTDLSDLIERVRKAEGPDRELDRAIGSLAGASETTFPQYEPDGVMPRYTGSIDAITALIAAKLPGWLVTMEFGEGKPCAMMLRPGFEDGRHVIIESAATLPLALCLALLVALTQEGQ